MPLPMGQSQPLPMGQSQPLPMGQQSMMPVQQDPNAMQQPGMGQPMTQRPVESPMPH